jgi:hypothetical protein
MMMRGARAVDVGQQIAALDEARRSRFCEQ